MDNDKQWLQLVQLASKVLYELKLALSVLLQIMVKQQVNKAEK